MPIESANRSEVREMEITIKATPEEIAKLLQAIGSSKEQVKYGPRELWIGGSKISSRP